MQAIERLKFIENTYFMRLTEDMGLISQILESRELKHPKIPIVIKRNEENYYKQLVISN